MPTTPSKTIRYGRPSLEIEFDQAALTAPGCCRYVPVVVRLCGIPYHQNVMVTVMFERTRKKKDGVPLDDYDLHPSSQFLNHKGIQGYHEYEVELLARPHGEETGTIRIKMESQAYNVLSEAVFRLDSRLPDPVASTLQKGSLTALRLLPRIRTNEERDALGGQYLPSAGTLTMPMAGRDTARWSDEIGTPSLFPLE